VNETSPQRQRLSTDLARARGQARRLLSRAMARWGGGQTAAVEDAYADLCRALDQLERTADDHLAQLDSVTHSEVELRRREREAIRHAREAERKARRSTAVTEQFLNRASHELRTPLSVLFGGAKVLRQLRGQLHSTAVDELLEDMEREGGRMRRAIDDLLRAGRDPANVKAGRASTPGRYRRPLCGQRSPLP
jgi:signal transduction histidine kinase